MKSYYIAFNNETRAYDYYVVENNYDILGFVTSNKEFIGNTPISEIRLYRFKNKNEWLDFIKTNIWERQ